MSTFTYQPNQYRGSHVSIFPLMEYPGENNTIQRNGDAIRVANETSNLILPMNFWYYMKETKPDSITKYAGTNANSPKFRWYPDEELLSILRGESQVFLSGDTSNLPKEKYIGWIDYAHDNGCYYSGTDNGLGCPIMKYPTEFKNCLIETSSNKIRKARSCENLNTQELQEMNILSDRAVFLHEVMGWMAGAAKGRHTLEQLNQFLRNSKSDLEKRRGKGNYVTELNGKTFQFEKIIN